MLKPADRYGDDEERPIGELIHKLVDDGKDYARAELKLGEAKVRAKVREAERPAALFGLGLVFAQAAVTALAIGFYAVIAKSVGPVFGGLIAAALFATAGYFIGRAGYRQLRALL